MAKTFSQELFKSLQIFFEEMEFNCTLCGKAAAQMCLGILMGEFNNDWRKKKKER